MYRAEAIDILGRIETRAERLAFEQGCTLEQFYAARGFDPLDFMEDIAGYKRSDLPEVERQVMAALEDKPSKGFSPRAKLYLGLALGASVLVSACVTPPEPLTEKECHALADEDYPAGVQGDKARVSHGLQQAFSPCWWVAESAESGAKLAEHYNAFLTNPLKAALPTGDELVVAASTFVNGLSQYRSLDLGAKLFEPIDRCLAKGDLEGYFHTLQHKYSDGNAPSKAELERGLDLVACYDSAVDDPIFDGFASIARGFLRSELAGAGIAGQEPPVGEAAGVLEEVKEKGLEVPPKVEKAAGVLGDEFCNRYPWWWDEGKCVLGQYLDNDLNLIKEKVIGKPLQEFIRKNKGDEIEGGFRYDLDNDGFLDYAELPRAIGFDIPGSSQASGELTSFSDGTGDGIIDDVFVRIY